MKTEIAEPDRDGSALRYRGVDIEELVGRVPFEGVWRLLVGGGELPEVEAPTAPRGGDNLGAPGCLFNGMIVPVLPYTIRGAIWYQGEANASNGTLYRKLFPAMIVSWLHGSNVMSFRCATRCIAGRCDCAAITSTPKT